MTALLQGGRIVVAGAGAIGSCVALRLAQAGARVTLCDPAPLGRNASGVAAGMLAPALEALFDPASANHFPLLLAARDRWPALTEGLGRPRGLDRSGALLVEGAASPERHDRLRALGAAVEAVTAAQARGLAEGLSVQRGALFCGEDWRIEAGPMLAALREAFAGLGGLILHVRVVAAEAGVAVLVDGGRLEADWVVFAGGFDPALAPELAALTPIKGQLLRFEAGASPAGGPIVRTPTVYIAPAPGGPAVGATMEPGRTDLELDPAAAERMRQAAGAVFPALAGGRASGRAGIRWAAPDGLPLVGASSVPGVFLAAGARRNGWLLAPMIAEMACDIIGGRGGGPYAAAFAPRRFRGR